MNCPYNKGHFRLDLMSPILLIFGIVLSFVLLIQCNDMRSRKKTFTPYYFKVNGKEFLLNTKYDELHFSRLTTHINNYLGDEIQDTFTAIKNDSIDNEIIHYSWNVQDSIVVGVKCRQPLSFCDSLIFETEDTTVLVFINEIQSLDTSIFSIRDHTLNIQFYSTNKMNEMVLWNLFSGINQE